jgi:putative MATE family efflux protein
LTDAAARAEQANRQAKFVSGSTMRHVVEMTAAGSIGLAAVFLVDFLSLLYISWLGDKSVTAGVGFATVILFLLISTNIGLMIAVGAVVSRALGSGDRERARELASASVATMSVAALMVTIVALPMLPAMLRTLGAEGKAFETAHRFLLIVLPSNVLMALGMGFSGVLRAVGDARRAMYVTLVGGLVTAFLDPLLIFVLKLGSDGAATATVVSRLVFALVGYWGVVWVHDLAARPRLAKTITHGREVLAVAGPAILTNLASPIAISFVTKIMSRYGDPAIAANAIIDRIVPLAFGGIFALTGAIGPILGQNWGALRFDRMRRALQDAVTFVVLYVVSVWLLLLLSRDLIVTAFGASGLTAELLRFFTFISGPIWLFMGLLFTANAAFNNLGFPLYATAFNWGRATLGTMPFVLIGAAWGGPEGILVGFFLGAVLFGASAIVIAFRCVARLGASSGPQPD